METYSFKSYGVEKLLREYAEAGLPDSLVEVEQKKLGEKHDALKVMAEDFVEMIESRIRKSIPSWSTSKPKSSGTGSTLVKQPGEKQKVGNGTITLTSGIKRVIPSNALGQIVQIDAALAELEKCGISGGYVPSPDSYLDSSLTKFVAEFVESRTPKAPEVAPVQQP